jgi:NarL family two-component system response regulator LiaR
MQGNLFSRNKTNIFYGVMLAALLVLLKWLELRFVIFDHAFEVYVGAIAIIFTALGIWLALKLTKPKVETIVVEKPVYLQPTVDFVINEEAVISLGLSKRELEVLQLMAAGYSNQEIAGKLYLSLSTIKTHSANLFEKLEAKRRTQAIEKAKRLNLIA